MVHLGKSPLPPSRPYRRPLTSPEYVKYFDPNVHVKVFKAAIITNNETNDAKNVNLFNFTLKDIMFDRCNNYLRDYLNCTFAELHLAFCKKYKKVQNDEQVYLQLKNMKHEKNENDTPPHSLKDSNASPKVEKQKKELGYVP
jgi:hypothetical protein